ncbi:hypothetical protein [Mesorhizobium sp. B4-1-4]|uniref:hypothetical protein n=1 Tax=Mesorhizobium sp. B4-1-4 TaxID=2589888 RepID=UPI001D00F25A|nr:hypothetical protein [Mesorhizobium sp. B4-1-4]UCI29596.1 hypothetical protein FJW03_17290 [Mesorhizobium sp. B4-1-4]
MRLIALRKSEAAAQEARRKINKEAKAKGNQVRPETLIAAGFVILVTSLGQEEFPAGTVSSSIVCAGVSSSPSSA